MHPARSVIIFTTLSGAGFGMLFFLGLGRPGSTGMVAFVFFALAYLLAVGGLVASTFHLGRRERALKAFSQWRTSWLSREAWLAMAALIVMALYGAGRVFGETHIAPLGALGAVLSLATVFATSMIYTQLRTVPRWNLGLTPILFMSLSLAGGALLSGQVTWAKFLIALSGAVQVAYWITGDTAFRRSGTTLATATGLGDIGTPRAFEPPHTGPNYLMNEMVHVVGRKHSAKLRIIAFVLMTLLPLLFLVLPFGHGLALLAVVSHIVGVCVARWLFFAEAEHVVGLYYGMR